METTEGVLSVAPEPPDPPDPPELVVGLEIAAEVASPVAPEFDELDCAWVVPESPLTAVGVTVAVVSPPPPPSAVVVPTLDPPFPTIAGATG